MEARVGIEPTHKGFADLSLTTWVPRPDSKVAGPNEKVHDVRVAAVSPDSTRLQRQTKNKPTVPRTTD